MEALLSPTNEFDLSVVLDDLKRTLGRLRTETKAISEREPPKLERLEKAIADLQQDKVAKHIFCPNEFLRYWQDLVAGRRQALEWRVVRALCWEPEAVIDINFHHYLDQAWPDLNPRALRGLILACHMRWSKDLATGYVVGQIRKRLNDYAGKNRLLVRWREAAAMLLGSSGAQEFGQKVIQSTASVTQSCKEWQLNEQSAYVRIAVQEATQSYFSPYSTNISNSQFLLELLGWQHWLKEDFKQVIGAAITHKSAQLNDEWRNQLIRFVLNHAWLGDPRLSSTKWIGISEEAKKRFIQWLSKADIIFFFEHVLGSYDPHGRRDFWLSYVGSLVQSRSLLRADDETRLSYEIRRHRGAMASYGRVKGVASSFLLDFGSIIAIEFSKDGAIYFYNRQAFNTIVPEFWQRGEFSETRLKSQRIAAGRIVHSGQWKYEAKTILAQHGIRPDA
jgi:hypothetical protein